MVLDRHARRHGRAIYKLTSRCSSALRVDGDAPVSALDRIALWSMDHGRVQLRHSPRIAEMLVRAHALDNSPQAGAFARSLLGSGDRVAGFPTNDERQDRALNAAYNRGRGTT